MRYGFVGMFSAVTREPMQVILLSYELVGRGTTEKEMLVFCLVAFISGRICRKAACGSFLEEVNIYTLEKNRGARIPTSPHPFGANDTESNSSSARSPVSNKFTASSRSFAQSSNCSGDGRFASVSASLVELFHQSHDSSGSKNTSQTSFVSLTVSEPHCSSRKVTENLPGAVPQ